MISVDQALEILDRAAMTVASKRQCLQRCTLLDALGRVTAKPIDAPISLPSVDNSAMDGFVLCSSEVMDATPESPVELEIVGESRAGDAPQKLPSGKYTMRIMTGAALPEGSDTVVKLEDVVERSGKIRVTTPLTVGQHVRRRGEEIAQGEQALPMGTVLTSSRIGFLAAMGLETIEVAEPSRVAIVATGSELVQSPQALLPGRIMDSNSVMLRACLAEMNLDCLRSIQIKDDPKTLLLEIEACFDQADVVLLTGGVSVGKYDYTRSILSDLGVQTHFWGVMQKPGKPLFLGQKDDVFIVGLPGNPFSAYVGFQIYVRRLLLQLMKSREFGLPSLQAKLLHPVKVANDRELFLKGHLSVKNDENVVEILDQQGSHILRPFCQANVLVRLAAGRKAKADESVEVFHLP